MREFGGGRGGRKRCAIFDIGVGGGGGRLREVRMRRSDGKGVLAEEEEKRINIETGFGNWFQAPGMGEAGEGRSDITSTNEKRCGTRGVSCTRASSPHPI